jgi:integrase
VDRRVRIGHILPEFKSQSSRLHEKSGKRHEVPCHPELEDYLAAWIKAAGIARDKTGPLFRSVGKGERLGEKAMSKFDVFHMIKRRAKVADLPYSTCCHTLRHRHHHLSRKRWNPGARPDHR